MPHVIVLASNRGEGNAYVRAHRDEFPRGRVIIPISAASIEGVVPSKVVVLPGFGRRRDRHALLASLRRAARKYQNIEWVEVPEVEPTPQFAVVGVPDGEWNPPQRHLDLVARVLPDPRGELTDEQIAEAYETNEHVTAFDAAMAAADGVIIEENGSQVIPPADLAASAVSDAPDPFLFADEPKAPAPKPRRRSKCKSCGTLHFPEQTCEDAARPDPFLEG